MSLPESLRLRTRLDALTWRLQEATEDLEKIKREARAADQQLSDVHLAELLHEEGPGERRQVQARSDAAKVQLAAEESLVLRLQERTTAVKDDYRRALSREWARRLVARWKQMKMEGDTPGKGPG